MLIHRVKRTDIPRISRLYYETVHRGKARDYSPEQIRAWAPRVYPDAFWQWRFRSCRVLVAEDDGPIVGFAELARTGELDCFYVHHAHQRRGVGSTLMARDRGNARLLADVSIAAEPFFCRMGFSVVRRQIKIYCHRAFKPAVMEERLDLRGEVQRTMNRAFCAH